MRLALRWIAVLLVGAGLVALWQRDASESNSEAAGPRERGRAEVAAPQEVSSVAESSPAVVAPTGVRAETALAASQQQPPAAGSNEETALIRVQVVAKETGAPLQGKMVVGRPHGASRWSVSATDLARGALGEGPMTDAEGRAELTVLARREHNVFLYPAEQRASLRTPALDAGDVHECVLEVPTRADLVFVGRVMDAQRQTAIAGASVDSIADWKDADDASLESTRSDEQGYFEVRVKSWQQRLIRVDAPGYAWTAVRAERGRTTRSGARDIALLRTGSAEVVVHGNGGAVAGAHVTLATKSWYCVANSGVGPLYFGEHPTWRATTDAGGVARFPQLPPRAPLEIRVAHGNKEHVEPDSLALKPSESRRVEVRLYSGVAVRGRLETSSGAAIADAEVWCVEATSPGASTLDASFVSALNGAGIRTTRSDPDGRFVFGNVSVGDWWIGPAPDSERERSQRPAPVAQYVRVRGDDRALDVVVRTDLGLYIRGRVSSDNEAPTVHAVFAWNESLRFWATQHVATNDSFELGPLLRGEYRVSTGGFEGDDGASQEVEVPAGATDVVLKVQRGGSLTVRVAPVGGEILDADIQVRSEAQLRGSRSSGAVNGESSFHGLPPGVYAVYAKTADGQFALRPGVVVRAGGASTEVDLTLERGARVELRFQGPEHRCACQLLVQGVTVDGVVVQRGAVGYLVVPDGLVELLCRTGVNGVPQLHALTLAPGEKRVVVLGK
jgi:hypothetical protein